MCIRDRSGGGDSSSAAVVMADWIATFRSLLPCFSVLFLFVSGGRQADRQADRNNSWSGGGDSSSAAVVMAGWIATFRSLLLSFSVLFLFCLSKTFSHLDEMMCFRFFRRLRWCERGSGQYSGTRRGEDIYIVDFGHARCSW